MQHGQMPLGTPFGPYTTAQEVIRDIDLTGKTAVVTGGASNLGLETVRILAWRGARVIVPVRDIGTAGKMLCNIPNVELFAMDLLDPASVRSFADKFVIEHGSLDILILSAGVMATLYFAMQKAMKASLRLIILVTFA